MDPKKVTDALIASTDATASEKGCNPAPVVAPKKVEPPSYDWLGPSLRRIYDDVLSEPIPEGFVDLLKQLYDRQKPR